MHCVEIFFHDFLNRRYTIFQLAKFTYLLKRKIFLAEDYVTDSRGESIIKTG